VCTWEQGNEHHEYLFQVQQPRQLLVLLFDHPLRHRLEAVELSLDLLTRARPGGAQGTHERGGVEFPE
jgi:hypothetical protein